MMFLGPLPAGGPVALSTTTVDEGTALELDVTSEDTAANAVVQFSHSHGGGTGLTKAIVAVCHFNNADNITSVTYGGEDMTQEAILAIAATHVVAIYSLIEPPDGTQTVLANFDAATQGLVFVATFTGGDATDAIRDTPVENSGSSTAASATVTSDDADIVLAVCFNDDSAVTQSVDGGSGITIEQEQTSFTTFRATLQTKAGASSVEMATTLSLIKGWGYIGCSVKG